MIPNVQAALNAILGRATTLRHANGAGRAFELFVMTGIGTSLLTRGYDVWLQRSDGSRVLPLDIDRKFVQRGGKPTGVMPAATGTGNASVIGFRWPGRTSWEIWNGIQFEGRSGAFHEIDIAIVPQDIGSTLRAHSVESMPLGRPRVAIECKDVKSAGSMDEMRAFVARLYDVTLLTGHHPYLYGTASSTPQAIHPGTSTITSRMSVKTYRQENQRTLNIIARKGGFAAGTAAMTGYHYVEPYENILVGTANTTALLDRVADWIQSQGY